MIRFKQFLSEAPWLMEPEEHSQSDNQIEKGKFKSKRLSGGKRNVSWAQKSYWEGDRTKSHETNIISSNKHYDFTKQSKNFYSKDVTAAGNWNLREHPRTGKYMTKKVPFKPSEARDTTFYAIHKETGEPHMKVNGMYTPSTKKFEISILKGHPESKIKAHEFYQHLILAGHVKELHSDTTHSPGGKKVWSKLRKMPNVKVTTSDNPDGHHVKNFDSHYVDNKMEEPIKNKYRSNQDGWEHIDYKKLEKDKDYKKLSVLKNRHFIAKGKV